MDAGRLLCILCCVLAATAQEEQKPSRDEKARQLLDSASEMVSTATPVIQVAALMQLAELYRDSDSKKALDLLDQALSSASALPPGIGGRPADMQSRIVRAAAEIDTNKAIEMLPAIPLEARSNALERIVTSLVEADKIDRALEVLERDAGRGGYPYRAASALLDKLPVEDPRRVTVFSSAASAVDASKPNDGFTALLAKHWKNLPRPMVDFSVAGLVNGILDQKSDATTVATLSTARGSVSFEDYKNYQLFDLMHLLQQADPKKAAELREKRPELDAALRSFPLGRGSMRDSESESISTSTSSRGKGGAPDPQQAAQMRLMAQADSISREAIAAAKEERCAVRSLEGTGDSGAVPAGHHAV